MATTKRSKTKGVGGVEIEDAVTNPSMYPEVQAAASFAPMFKDKYFILRVPDGEMARTGLVDLNQNWDAGCESIQSEGRWKGRHAAYPTLEEALNAARFYCAKRQEADETYRYIIVKSCALVEPETPPVMVTRYDDFTDS